MWKQHGAFLNDFEIAATRVAALQLTGIARRGITDAFARRTDKCRAAIAGSQRYGKLICIASAHRHGAKMNGWTI